MGEACGLVRSLNKGPELGHHESAKVGLDESEILRQESVKFAN